MSVVLLRLEGPMQAWSSQGKLGVRDTEREPTKSGVLGLVGAALGMSREDDATLAALATLRMAVRVDRAGSLLRDFHTTGAGSFRGMKSYLAYGVNSCIPTDRYYLQGASFIAALEGDSALIGRIDAALRAPRYPLFLGRRSCPPSVPVSLGVVEGTARDAVRAAPLADSPDKGPYRVVVESAGGKGDPCYDVPLSFSQAERRYGLRYVTTEWVAPSAPDAEVSA